MDHKEQNLRFYSSNIACQQYGLSEKICLELKVRMSSFLDIRSSHPKVSCKKGALKNFAELIKIIRDAVINLIKFHAKGLQLF